MARGTLKDLGLLLLRTSGGMMATHGFTKLQWALADAPRETWTGFVWRVESLGFPQPEVFAWATVLAEFVAGACVLLGLFTRVSASLVAFTMFVAAFVRHWEDPFKDKELALVYLAIMLCLACVGGGKWTVESAWRKKRQAPRAVRPQA